MGVPGAAGLRLGPDRVVDCVRALELADCNRRDDWYWTMSAVFLSKEEQRPIFDQAFRIFWRDPKLTDPSIFNFFDHALEGEAKYEWAFSKSYNAGYP